MDNTALIARLQSRTASMYLLEDVKLFYEAADALQAVQAEIEQLKAELGDLPEAQADMLHTIKVLRTRITALEKQEPVAEVVAHFRNAVYQVRTLCYHLENGTKLYEAAGAAREPAPIDGRQAVEGSPSSKNAGILSDRPSTPLMGAEVRTQFAAAGASPEPSALQLENAKLITALAACRDVFPVPAVDTELDAWYAGAIADPLAVPEYVRACVVGASPQPESFRLPSRKWSKEAEMVESWTDGASPQPVHGLQSVADALTIEQLNAKVERLMAAQPSQAGELTYAQRLDIVTNWFSDEADITRAMQVLTDFEQTSAAINAKGAV